jgi:hypothetical protein
LATAVVLAAAAIWLERRLVLVAIVSFLVFSIPHTIYHLFNLGGISTGDAVTEALLLVLTVIAPLALLAAMLRPRPQPADG